MKLITAFNLILLAPSLFIASVFQVSAQEPFPSRPIRIVVTFPAGGGPDIMARIVSAKMTENTGKPVLVENKAGASGIIGAELVAKSTPDGYTVLLATPAPITIAGGSGRKLNYSLKDFAGVTQGVLQTPILVVASDSPYKTTADLIATAAKKPGSLTFGSAGVGNSQHLAGEQFNQMAGINTLHVPFPGTALGLVAVMTHQIDFYFSDPSALPHVRSGKLRALGVTTTKRSANLPDVPTVSESGLPGFEYTNWYGFMVPAKTPPAVIQYLQREIHKVLSSPDVREKLVAAGMDPAPSTPEEFDAFLPKDQDKWARVVRYANVKFD